MSVPYRVFRATRRLPVLKEATDFAIRAGRKLFWSLRPANTAQFDSVPADYLSAVTAQIAGGPDAFTLIEVGCGDGRTLARFAEGFTHAHFIGVDIQKSAVELGNARFAAAGMEGVKLICSSCLDDGVLWQCDYMISRTALIYLNREEMEIFLCKRLPQIAKRAIFQEIVSTTGKTEHSHFYAHPLAKMVEEAAPGVFGVSEEFLDYPPWKGAKWSGANIVLTRKAFS